MSTWPSVVRTGLSLSGSGESRNGLSELSRWVCRAVVTPVNGPRF